MHRSKLQKLVKSALTPTGTVSNEGLLSDLTDKVSSVFSSRVKVLTPTEEKKFEDDLKQIVDRLNKTVLNATWLEKAKFSETAISADWAISGLNYDGSLKADASSVPAIVKATTAFQKDFEAYGRLVSEYTEKSNAWYEKLLKDCASAFKKSGDISSVLSAAVKTEGAIKAPAETLRGKTIRVFGGEELTFDKSINGVTEKAVSISKPESILPLTKDEVKTIADLIVELLAPQNKADPEAWNTKHAVDWDDLESRLVKEGLSEADASEIYDEVSDAAARFYHQNAWNETGHYEFKTAYGHLVMSLIRWINASVK